MQLSRSPVFTPTVLVLVPALWLGCGSNDQQSSTTSERQLSAPTHASCDLSAFNGTGTDASAALQACIDATADGGILALAPGRYTLAQPVTAVKALTLASVGLGSADTPCGDQTDARCAGFVTAVSLPGNEPMVILKAASSAIDHIVFDGNGYAWRAANPAACGAAPADKRMFTLALGDVTNSNGTSHLSMTNSVVFNARCGAGVWVGFADDQTFVNNKFLHNGAHVAGPGMQWAVGIEFSGNDGLTYAFNDHEDNSDGDVQFGNPCRNCSVHDNTFLHHPLTFPDGVAHCALCTGAYAGAAPADYTGSVIEHNFIDCGARAPSDGVHATVWGCGIGLDWGQQPWGVPAPMTNGAIQNNLINNALIGVYLGAANGTYVYNNAVNPGNADPGCLTTLSADRVITPVLYVMQPANQFVRTNDGINDSDVFSNYVTADLSGWLPNVAGHCAGVAATPLAPPAAPIGGSGAFTPAPPAPPAPAPAPTPPAPSASTPPPPPPAPAPAPAPAPVTYGPMPPPPSWVHYFTLTVQYSNQGPMINDAYSLCLGHLPSPSDGSYWYNLANTTPWDQIYADICHSLAFQERVINEAYATCLGRAPDTTGANAWLYSFSQGALPEQVWTGICMTPEALSRRVL
jgi:hypothetical protein